MADFMFTYHGGRRPESPEEGKEAMKKWQEWEEKLGSALKRPGTPLGKTEILEKGKPTGGSSSNPMAGFAIISASSMEEAVLLLKDCPFFDMGGRLELSEIMVMPS